MTNGYLKGYRNPLHFKTQKPPRAKRREVAVGVSSNDFDYNF